MEIYQNREKRKRLLIANIILMLLFYGIGLFIFFILIGTLITQYAHNQSIEIRNFILIIPFLFFGLTGQISFFSFNANRKFLKIQEPILSFDKNGLSVYHSPKEKLSRTWDQLGEIEFRNNRFQGRRMNQLVITDVEGSTIAIVLVGFLEVNLDEVIDELKKYKSVTCSP
ncbi:hypothetical protein [Shimazuella kribbensis]|uniref:hypothetical protein n=1 Tax=Shimazuella kribbensis TaxID=139808 RepID=UPI0004274F3A|nr:hypothetical protein [Shimazuella kribbensis]